ncbi:polysaccharide biosynthesis/export family protein [Olleya marilimosa]|uniref:Polysaccharide biosynthesis/export family protein n=1 Tax=Olleya marilimosa TaxID=272164 RepID=A0ABR8LZ96_9FLAO|nr:polysaccharide biosynthesis/export family protein [Olleya marilimosa]MBD3863572.1 polysaccharide biosynthesis/export family protein [Olleya marilimosa]MBD3891329.1 polysaccharide biosynthesis/export family protein [Olleya marilimosa]
MKQIVMCFVIVLSLISTSCITQKDVVYLQDKGTVINDSLQLQALASPYRVQVNDILSISIKSTDSELKKLVEIFQPTEQSAGTSGNGNLYFSGFTVDLHGNIEFPILDKVNVLGYTTEEIEDKVRAALLDKYLKDVSKIFITVKLAGLRYTVTGEVGGGGVLTLYQDRVNIIEALANAGDITDTGDRKDVLVIRQYPNGQKIHHIDLTDVAALKSPYYYIQPNDMILVKPLKRKALGAGQTATQTFTTIASIFSVLVSTYFLAKNL